MHALRRPGISWRVLIQRAGHAVSQFCAAHFKFTTVCVVCGTGGAVREVWHAVDFLSQFPKAFL